MQKKKPFSDQITKDNGEEGVEMGEKIKKGVCAGIVKTFFFNFDSPNPFF